MTLKYIWRSFSVGCHFHVPFSYPWHAFASHGLSAIAELLVCYPLLKTTLAYYNAPCPSVLPHVCPIKTVGLEIWINSTLPPSYVTRHVISRSTTSRNTFCGTRYLSHFYIEYIDQLIIYSHIRITMKNSLKSWVRIPPVSTSLVFSTWLKSKDSSVLLTILCISAIVHMAALVNLILKKMMMMRMRTMRMRMRMMILVLPTSPGWVEG